MICDDVVRNEEMVHPAAEEGAGVAMIVLLKAQKVNAAVYTVHVHKPIEGPTAKERAQGALGGRG